jgi:hypothetical protein
MNEYVSERMCVRVCVCACVHVQSDTRPHNLTILLSLGVTDSEILKIQGRQKTIETD